MLLPIALLLLQDPATGPLRASPPVDVFVADSQGAARVRIPGLARTTRGTLLAFAEGRANGGDPGDEGAIVLIMRRSIDGGRSWEPAVTLESDPRFDFANPTPLVDHETETVWIAYDRFPDRCGSNRDCTTPGNDPRDTVSTQTAWVRASHDDGLTWGDPVLLPKPIVTADSVWWRSATVGPGSGIQLDSQADAGRDGRLMIPARRIGATSADGRGQGGEPFVFRSDDHGATWQLGGVTSGAGANEAEVVELHDGRLMIDGRQNSGGHRWRWWSDDGGATWDAPVAGDIAITPVDASLIRLRDGRLAFTGPIGPGRANLGLWLSSDGGRSFALAGQVAAGFAAYSVAVQLPDGALGVLYESEPTSRIVFVRVAIE